MIKRYILLVLMFALAIFLVLMLTPIGKERSIKLAQARFDEYCIENRFDCSGFEAPKYETTSNDNLRLYTFELQINEAKTRITYEVRIPINEWGKTTIGTESDTALILEHLRLE